MSTTAALPAALEAALARTDDLTAAFDDLMVALCDALSVDRCFLYLRDPDTGIGGVVACASVEDRWPDLRAAPTPEAPDLAVADPLMGWAHRMPGAIYVADIETAGADILDVEFERSGFGHRALVHAPVVDPWPEGGRLLGILEPCVFDTPRLWSPADRALVAAVQGRLSPLAARAIAHGWPGNASEGSSSSGNPAS